MLFITAKIVSMCEGHVRTREQIKPGILARTVYRFAGLAGFLDDILEMPRGFDTELGESGVRLSGGQAQRLAIARALLRKTPVLILDEATSSLDNVTQKKVMESIAESRQTVIMIAHRLSSIKDADRIAVLSDGKITAEGTHEELLSICEEYRNLYQSEK